MAIDAFDLLDHFGWKEKVHLVGISMGGMISLEMADAEPARFQSLTLTSTTSKRNIPTVRIRIVDDDRHSLIIILFSGQLYLHFQK